MFEGLFDDQLRNGVIFNNCDHIPNALSVAHEMRFGRTLLSMRIRAGGTFVGLLNILACNQHTSPAAWNIVREYPSTTLIVVFNFETMHGEGQLGAIFGFEHTMLRSLDLPEVAFDAYERRPAIYLDQDSRFWGRYVRAPCYSRLIRLHIIYSDVKLKNDACKAMPRVVQSLLAELEGTTQSPLVAWDEPQFRRLLYALWYNT